MNPEFTLYGLDLSDEMLKIANEKLNNHAYLVQGDAEKLPYCDESFDLLICNDSFHHYPNPKTAFSEFYRVLKKGGKLLLGDIYQPLIVRSIMNFYMKYSKEGDVKIYSKKEIIQFSNHVDFQKIHYQIIDKSNFLAVCHKSHFL